jgi:transcriptional regulator with XRE-family HTH domain
MKENKTNNIRKLRREKDFSQEYVAFQLGISQKSYSKIENGKTELKHSILLSLARIFDTTPDKLCPISNNCNCNNS